MVDRPKKATLNGRQPAMNADQALDRAKAFGRQMANNVTSARQEIFRRLLDPRRSIEDECGYPRGYVESWVYWDLYDTDSLAARVIEVVPKEVFKVKPQIHQGDDRTAENPFNAAVKELGEGMRAEPSYHAAQEGNALLEYVLRAYILSRIGRYGVMLLGFDDIGPDDPLTTPVKPKPGRRLLYVRVFPETLAQINRFVTDRSDPRYGQPEEYSLDFNDPNGSVSAYGPDFRTQSVHWSRVIHVADGLRSNEVFGRSELQQVLRNILAAQKPTHSSAEGYWKTAFTGISLETDPSLGGDVEFDEAATKAMYEEYINGLQRGMILNGLSAKTIAPTVVDPTPFVDLQIKLICIKLGIPIPVFQGYEIGEQASENNDDDWNDRVKGFQHDFVTPRIIVPLIDRLINVGVLPQPEDGYRVFWPDMSISSDVEKADVAVKQTQAVAAYTAGGCDSLIPPIDFLTRILGWEEDEAQAVLDNAAAAADGGSDTGRSPLLSTVGGATALVEMFRAAKEGAFPSIDEFKASLKTLFLLDDATVDAMVGDDLSPAADEAAQGEVALEAKKVEEGVVVDPLDQAKMDAEVAKKGLDIKAKQATAKGPPAKGPPKPPVGNADQADNRFCPTGPGGGIDPTCGSDAPKAGGVKGRVRDAAARVAAVKDYIDGKIDQSRAGGAYRFAKKAVHKVEAGMSIVMKQTQKVAVQAARERGLSEEHVAKVARVTAAVDFAASFALSKGTFAATGSMAAGYVVGMMPSASIGYLAYSTARDPRATLRAAKKYLRGEITMPTGPTTHAANDDDREVKLLEYFNSAADADWAHAVLAAALDENGYDLDGALVASRKVLERQPTAPPEGDEQDADRQAEDV